MFILQFTVHFIDLTEHDQEKTRQELKELENKGKELKPRYRDDGGAHILSLFFIFCSAYFFIQLKLLV